MSLVAKAPEGTHVIDGNDVFDFADGSRQVTHAEAERLKELLGSKVSIEEAKPQKEGSK